MYLCFSLFFDESMWGGGSDNGLASVVLVFVLVPVSVFVFICNCFNESMRGVIMVFEVFGR